MKSEKNGNIRRVLISVLLCTSMILGAFGAIIGTVEAQTENAIFMGNVTVGGTPSNETLVMYSYGDFPERNSTITNTTGDYEIWVLGGLTYSLLFANGAAMFDDNAEIENNHINPSETKIVNTDLTPAPARTATIRGYVTNASNVSQPVTTGHPLGLIMDFISGGDPEYINWSTTNSSGYYQMNVLPGSIALAVFDADGYLPGFSDFNNPLILADGESGWLNISLLPLSAANIAIIGNVTDINTTLPIAGAVVSAELEGAFFSDTDVTDANGTYTLNMLPGYGSMTITAIGYTGLQEENVDFMSNSTKNFSLYANNARVWGYILDDRTMSPIGNASVDAYNSISANQTLFNRTTSRSDGYYEMNLTNSSWWSVGAYARGYGSNGTSVTLNVSDNIRVDILLPPEDSIFRGYITNSSSGLPIENALVRVEERFGGENGTRTNATGFYEIYVTTGSYQFMLMANGYMGKYQMGGWMDIGPTEILWENISLDPVTTELNGAVTNAITGAPIAMVSISIWVFSNNSSYMGFAMGNSDMAGNYSIMVSASADTWFSADLFNYQSYNNMLTIPVIPIFQYNFSLLPMNPPEYTLIGYINDSVSLSPIPFAEATAYNGMSTVNSTGANGSGYYEFNIPTARLNVTASGTGYLPSSAMVTPGAVGERVWYNFSLTPHSEYPTINNTVNPDENISILNHADLYARITETYLETAVLALYDLYSVDSERIWIHNLNEILYYSAGSPFNQLDGGEISPGVWELGIWNWDTEMFGIDDFIVMMDGDGNAANSMDFWFNWFNNEYEVWGSYMNSSMGFPVGSTAHFDSSGNMIGIDWGIGPDPAASSDPTGTFWQDLWINGFNVSLGNFDRSRNVQTPAFNTSTMYLDNPGTLRNYMSGNYAMLFYAWDIAALGTLNATTFTIDNSPPNADAGPGQDQYLNLAVELNGSASIDNMGVVNYTWNFMDGATPVELYGAVAQYTFTAVGNYSITLTVYDGVGHNDTDTTYVNAVADVNPPVADAGVDQTVDEDALMTFNGSASTDNAGIVNYTWTFVDGTPQTLYGMNPNYTFADPGSYNVTLTVTDSASLSGSDNLTVTVNDLTDPIADAGLNRTIGIDMNVTFNGSGSTDNGIIANYTWNFTDGGAQILYGINPVYLFSNTGIFNVTLNVTDAGGNSDTDVVTITVIIDTSPPTADAGPDQNVDEDTVMTFDGSGSTDNVGVVNYTWTFVDGTAQTLYGVNPTYNFTELGSYNVTLNVTDGVGLWNTDNLTITVADATPPTADAGSPQTVDEEDLVTFDGSGSTDNVGIVNYTWTFTDGTLQTLYGISPTYTFANAGTYNVTLNVTDSVGLWDTDTVQITVQEVVTPVDTTDPIADAGSDQTVEAGAEVTFDGSGSSDNVGVVNYTWTFIAGGETRTRYGVSPKFTFDEAGDYIVTLTVKDAANLTDTDTVTITVQGAASISLLDDYWWIIVIVAALAAAIVLGFVLMKRRGGDKPSPPQSPEEEVRPKPELEDELPPPPED